MNFYHIIAYFVNLTRRELWKTSLALLITHLLSQAGFQKSMTRLLAGRDFLNSQRIPCLCNLFLIGVIRDFWTFSEISGKWKKWARRIILGKLIIGLEAFQDVFQQIIFSGWVAQMARLLPSIKSFFRRFVGNLNARINFHCPFARWFVIPHRIFRWNIFIVSGK